MTCAPHTCFHTDFLPCLCWPHLPHSGDQESSVCPERRPSPDPGPAPCSVDLGWGTCSGVHTTLSVQQQEAKYPWGPGDDLAVPTCFLPLDGAQINHGRGLDRQRAPACLQPTWVPTATAPLGAPCPLSSTCHDWTPRASPGITQTTGATLGRPRICRPALPDWGKLPDPASSHNVSIEPMPIKHRGPAYHFQLHVQEFAGTIHRRLSWNNTRKRSHCVHRARELTARDTELRGGAWTSGHLQSSGLICPMGLRMGVPDTTTEEARP